jgi:lipid A ethanolaminephosphotransferase
MRDRFSLMFRSPLTAASISALLLLAFHNFRFWRETIAALWNGTITDALFIVSLFVVLFFVYSTFLLLIPGQRIFRIVVPLLFLVAAVASYSADAYGIFIDKEMIRNLFETDQREAAALLNMRFLLYVLLLGALPAILIRRMNWDGTGIRKNLLQRLVFVLAGCAISAAMLFMFSAHYSSFIREHKSLRYLLSPAAAIQGTIQFVRGMRVDPDKNRLVDEDGVPVRLARSAKDKPILMFLVVGETARADNFQLGGYKRGTNPELSKINRLYYFNNFTSCGTSTAISLPCMFSHLGQHGFDVDLAGQTTNLVDSLLKAQIRTEWRDNNSGSKGVSQRISTVSYAQHRDASLCNEESCFDEIMLQGLPQKLQSVKEDTVLVFHQLGSHGPAYSKRYPSRFEKFKPVCRSNELKQCADEEIRNAYDNTILYTDYNLAQQIHLLQAASDRFDTVFIYVSDHGESLGENGLYLHGAPYAFAPDVQTRVPFMLWMSEGYGQRFGINDACLRSQLSGRFSHDNLYHTVLGAMATRNAVYQPALDMLAACRSRPMVAQQSTDATRLE